MADSVEPSEIGAPASRRIAPGGLSALVLSSIGWIGAARIVTGVGGVLRYLIFARLLRPFDFGVFGAASAADKVTIPLKWVTQSQFAGDARKNPDEAAKIVLAADTTGANRKAPKTNDGRNRKLLDTREGKLDPKDCERTVAALMSGGSDPVITKKPDGAWTHVIYGAMK